MDIVTYILARRYVDKKIIEAGGVTLDTTLTKAGQAADAKAVGDRFSEILPETTVDDAGKHLVVDNGGKISFGAIKYLGDIMQ